MNQEISKLKLDLKRANRWTNSSRIVHKLSEKNFNEKAGLGFHKSFDDPKDLCYICGNLGHPTTECPVAAKSRLNSQNLDNRSYQTKRNKTSSGQRNRLHYVLPAWTKRNLIHPFTHKIGPKLVWVPKSNHFFCRRR